MTKLNEHWNNLSKEAKELVLWADNDRHMHDSSKHPILKNLSKKARKGVYDSKLAAKLWGYHADRAAIGYHKEMGEPDQPWHKAWPKTTRAEAAAHWEDFHKDELKDYDDGKDKKVHESLDEALSIPDKHQHKICVDNVKNPMKARILGGPSAEEAEHLLRTKFGYKDHQIKKLKEEIESDEPDLSNHYRMLDTVIQGKASEFQDLFNKTVLGKLRINVEAVKEALRPTLFTGIQQEEVDGEQLEEKKNPLLARLGA